MTPAKPVFPHFLRAAAFLPLLLVAPAHADPSLDAAFHSLEQQLGGRIGVVAIDTGSGKRIAHRPDERFPTCSSFKMVLAAAILNKSVNEPGFLQKPIAISAADMIHHAPVTSKHQGKTL